MAWTTPRTWTTSEVVTAAMMNTHVRDNEVFLRAFHGARMWEAAAESQTSTGNYQLITWDTTDYDSDSFAVLASEWFVVPSGFDGTFRVAAHVEFASGATGFRQLKLMKNETYTTRTPNGVGTALSEDVQPALTGSRALTVIWQGPLVAGDHVTLEALQGSGGNLALNVGKFSVWIEAHYLGN